MTSRLKGMTAALALAAALGIAAGCSNVDPEAAQTPTGAPTAANSAIQTDADGNTIETEPQADTSAAGGDGGQTGGADEEQIAAGLVVFQRSCTTCHLQDGNAAGGIGPQLAGMGLNPEGVRAQVVNGGATMPAGLATGQDLDDVVAYVQSLQ